MYYYILCKSNLKTLLGGLMRKFLLSGFTGLLLLANFICATPNQEALDSLDAAKNLISKAKYSKALDEINYAVSKINELLSEKLKSFIPEKGPSGYNLTEKNAQGLGAAGAIVGSTNSLTGVGRYENDSDSSIELTIASGGLLGKTASFANFGNMFGSFDNSSGNNTKSVRINGYTGSLTENSSDKSGTLSIQIGEKTSITINGYNIESIEVLMELAKKIDLSGLEEAF